MKQLQVTHPVNPWPPQMVVDLAVGVEEVGDILMRYGMDADDYEALLANPIFRTQLAVQRKMCVEEGISYREKAKVLAEMHLTTMDQLLVDDLTPPATKLGIWQSLTKYGGLEPKPSKEEGNSGPTFHLEINL